jgi:hypothetical protein
VRHLYPIPTQPTPDIGDDDKPPLQPPRPGEIPDDPIPVGVPIDDPDTTGEPPIKEPPGTPGPARA